MIIIKKAYSVEGMTIKVLLFYSFKDVSMGNGIRDGGGDTINDNWGRHMLSVEDIQYRKSEIKVHPQDMIDMSVHYNESRNNSSWIEKFAISGRKVYICKFTKVMGINVNNDLGGRNCGSFL